MARKRKEKSFLKKQVVNKKILVKESKTTLDLRARPGREVPVKQHGFKEMSISNINVLNQ